MIFQSFYDSPIGQITLCSDGKYLINLSFFDMKEKKNYVIKEMTIFKKTKEWLDLYFLGRNPDFIPEFKLLNLTSFQMDVLNKIIKIPYGENRTYKDIANLFSNKMSSQAIGNALHKNPIAIIIPCHRIISKNSIGGYAYGIERKKFLLDLEANKNRTYR